MVKSPERKKVEPKTYSVWAKFNGVEIRKRTNDLNKTLKDLRPDWLHTEVFFKIKKNGVTSERHLNLIQAKRMFSDDFNREVFINNLAL